MPVELAINGATRRVPVPPLPLTESARPRVEEAPIVAGDGRFVGESARLGVLASGTVRGRPPSERPVCDGVNCRSSTSSGALSVVSVCSALVMKLARVGLSTRVGRRSGPGELAASPEWFPVSFQPTVVGNKVPLRVEVCGGGVRLGDKGGLATGRWGVEEDVSVAREGDMDGNGPAA